MLNLETLQVLSDGTQRGIKKSTLELSKLLKPSVFIARQKKKKKKKIFFFTAKPTN